MNGVSTGFEVQGFVSSGFEAVRDEFERSFAERGEVGAAFAAVRRGEVVADLWGGVADAKTGRPWRDDTLQLVFSGTKGLVGVALLLLADRGTVDPSAPVATYWPEFGAAGKHGLTVREAASHQARLPGIDTPLTEAEVLDDVRMAALLASQPPDGDPRAAAYHPLTYGWLCGEVVRRADGRSIGTFFDEEVATPLGLEIWIGLPESLEDRVSTLTYAANWAGDVGIEEDFARDELLSRVYANPRLFPTTHIPWNTREFHAAEIPGANAIGTARSIARLYGCLANGGEIGGTRLFSARAIEDATRCLVRRQDPLLDEPCAYGLGFELQTEIRPLGPPGDAFGYTGAGGSCHGAWPRQRVGFSYCMNEMRDDEPVDARSRALLRALYDAL